MKAIQIEKTGGPDVLQLKEVAKPRPGKGEALIKLKAAGVNFIDIYMRNGRYPNDLPFIPGNEGAGIVEEIGEGVSEVRVGDRVAYTARLGSYAEYKVVKAISLIPLPDSISFEQGAAFPLQGMTAHYLLHEFYKIKPGDKVLVHAAAGGVGGLLVQWLKKMGADIFATVSTQEKADIARANGAQQIILYSQKDFAEEIKRLTDNIGVDYIIDGVGKSTFPKDLEAVRTRGHICLFGASSGAADPFPPNSLQAKSITLSGGSLFNYLNTREELLTRANAVLEGMKAGWLKLKIDRVLPLDKAAEAHRLLEGRQTSGKLILEI